MHEAREKVMQWCDAMLELRRSHAEKAGAEHSEAVLCDVQRACTVAVSRVRFKFSFLSQAPYNFSECHTAAGCATFCASVQAIPPSRRDRITSDLWRRLEPDLRLAASTQNFSASLLQEVSLWHLFPITESQAERVTTETWQGSPSPLLLRKLPYTFAQLRLSHNIAFLEEALALPGGPEKVAWCWKSYKSVVRVHGRGGAGVQVRARNSRLPFKQWQQTFYRLGAYSFGDLSHLGTDWHALHKPEAIAEPELLHRMWYDFFSDIFMPGKVYTMQDAETASGFSAFQVVLRYSGQEKVVVPDGAADIRRQTMSLQRLDILDFPDEDVGTYPPSQVVCRYDSGPCDVSMASLVGANKMEFRKSLRLWSMELEVATAVVKLSHPRCAEEFLAGVRQVSCSTAS